MMLQEKGSLFISRFSAPFYFDEFPQYLQNFVAWIKEGKLNIRIERTYPLAEAAQAHTTVEQRQVSGRVLLLP